MPTIVVSDYAYKTINATALVPFEQAGEQRPNGDWEVFVSETFIECLKPRMELHETVGEAIARWFPVRGAAA